jgi:hypothetical protein
MVAAMSQPSAYNGEWVPLTRREATHEEIARHARNLWEQYGRPAGRDEQIWLEAERQLRGLDLTQNKLAQRLVKYGLNGASRSNGHSNGHSTHPGEHTAHPCGCTDEAGVRHAASA